MSIYPKVIGLVTTYKSEHLIIATLETLAAQDYPNFEVIICDDYSPDNTFTICCDFATQHPNFKVIRNESNLGWFANSEKGWKIAVDQSDYCFLSPHDDHLLPAFVSEQVEIMTQNPKAVLCIPGMENRFKDGNRFISTYLNPTEKPDPVDRVLSILDRGGHHWWAAYHGLFKSSTVKQIIPVKKLRFGEKEFCADLLWLIEISFLGEFVHSKNVLFSKNYDSKSLSASWKHGILNKAALWIGILDCIKQSPLLGDEKGRIRKGIFSLFTRKIARRIKI
jgi:glycosyltransferase involved in cell wall biosynthesis